MKRKRSCDGRKKERQDEKKWNSRKNSHKVFRLKYAIDLVCYRPMSNSRNILTLQHVVNVKSKKFWSQYSRRNVFEPYTRPRSAAAAAVYFETAAIFLNF